MLWIIASVWLFAQSPANEVSAEYAGRWIGPVLSSAASLVATVFAYLTARDSKKYDAEKLLMKADLEQAKKDNKECEDDRAAIRLDLKAMKDDQDKKYRELWNEIHGGQRATAPEGENDEDDQVERRTAENPNYRGPRRRRTDPKTKTHTPLPKPPETPS